MRDRKAELNSWLFVADFFRNPAGTYLRR